MWLGRGLSRCDRGVVGLENVYLMVYCLRECRGPMLRVRACGTVIDA